MKRLYFWEENEWEGETWEIYCDPRNDEDLAAMEALVQAFDDSGIDFECYGMSIVETDDSEIQTRSKYAEDGYYPSVQWFDAGDAIIEDIVKLTEMLAAGDREHADEAMYKLSLFY